MNCLMKKKGGLTNEHLDGYEWSGLGALCVFRISYHQRSDQGVEKERQRARE